MSVRQGVNTIAGAVGKYPLNERNITNCITNIPQDIKLELNNGTLTLKAGSKVYVPNGAGVFDVVTIESDLTRTTFGSETTSLLYYAPSTNKLTYEQVSTSSSGSSHTPTAYSVWYDTANNVVNRYEGDASTPVSTVSLPIAIIKTSSSAITSIDQVFNGFGYIGLTVFALPGLKVLIPDGKNSDGTLKNTEFVTSNVLKVTSITGDNDECVVISSYGLGRRTRYYYTYNKEENRNKYLGVNDSGTPICCYNRSSGYISNFNYKTVFHAVDYSDSNYIANCAMPSNKYIDLTLGASGTSYTAPADGYVLLAMRNTDVYCEMRLNAGQLRVGSNYRYDATGYSFSLSIPISKGNSVTAIYTNMSPQTFRFVYANGAQ
jgi:hypothetical protein